MAQRKNEFDTPFIGVLAEALRLANSPHDRVVLRRLCTRWERATGMIIDAHAVGAAAALVGGDFLRAWVELAEASEGGQDHPALPARSAPTSSTASTSPMFVDSFLDGGWQSWADDEPAEAVTDELEIWRALHRDILQERGSRMPLNTYLHRLDMSSKTPPPAPNAVHCLTVHGSKGLQFPHVYLIGMAQDVFPSFQALKRGQDSKGLEEERRNCFVAMTRASKSLTLTRAEQYNGRPRSASQFLEEMGL